MLPLDKETVTLMKIKTISLILLAIGLCSCEATERPEHEEPSTQESRSYETEYGSFVLSEGTIYLTDNGENGISIIDASTLSVKKSSITDSQKAKEGDIYLYTRTGDMPQGFLGRVDAVSDDGECWIFHTSPVNLDEVFDEIHLEGDLEMSGKDGTYLDENGEQGTYSVVDNSIWDTLDEYEMIEETSPSLVPSANRTKVANAGGKGERTFEFKIKTGNNVEGTIYLGLGIHANITKETDGNLECNFKIATRIGAKASLTLKAVEKKIPFLKIKKMLPMNIVAGPLILTPEIVLEEGIRPFAKVSLESELKLELFNTIFDAGFYAGGPHFSTTSGPQADTYFKVISIQGSAGISLYSTLALQLDMYGLQDILAVGVKGEDESKISLNGDILLNSKDLLSSNPNLRFDKTRSVECYVHSQAFKLFGATDGTFSSKDKFDLGADMGLFPEHVGNITSKVNSCIRAAASGVNKGLTSVAEHGFALFKDETVLEHRNLEESAAPATTASSNELSAEFEMPDDAASYSVKEYVMVNNSEGEHYYYKSIGDCPNEDHVHAIDLGLSVKWACCNVGATKPEEYGGYYAWGETEEKSVYTEETYKYAHGIYIDDGFYEDTGRYYDNIGSDISCTQYDVAYVKLGEHWRMPSYEEMEELLENCTSQWTTVNEVAGRKFTSKINGNSIFLPAAGARFDEFAGGGFLGGYWSSSLYQDNPKYAYLMSFLSNDLIASHDCRCFGICVRPVFIEEKESE